VKDDQDRAAELGAKWCDQLRRTGEIRIGFAADDERDLYRRAGRQAGRLLKRPIRTVVAGNTVVITLEDWMDNPLERRLEDTRTRKAVDRAFTATGQQRPAPAPTVRPVTRLHPNPTDDAH
jgi:hypothetical protein